MLRVGSRVCGGWEEFVCVWKGSDSEYRKFCKRRASGKDDDEEKFIVSVVSYLPGGCVHEKKSFSVI